MLSWIISRFDSWWGHHRVASTTQSKAPAALGPMVGDRRRKKTAPGRGFLLGPGAAGSTQLGLRDRLELAVQAADVVGN